ATGVIDQGSQLSLGGGAFSLAARTSSQQFSSTSITAGSSRIIAASIGAGNTLSLNSINQNVGGTVDFTLPTTGSINTTTANANPSGGPQTILGGYATVGGTTGAVSALGGSAGDISGLTAYSATFSAAADVNAPTGTSTP